jgi:hypothetical protein
MSKLERVSEELARRLGRRQFLDRAARTVFAVAAGLAVKSSGALAQEEPDHPRGSTCPVFTCSNCYCQPPVNGLCTNWNSSYCYGSKCSGGCVYDTDPYSTGCWCTKECVINGDCGHYRCCDCWCANYTINCQCLQRHRVADTGSACAGDCTD